MAIRINLGEYAQELENHFGIKLPEELPSVRIKNFSRIAKALNAVFPNQWIHFPVIVGEYDSKNATIYLDKSTSCDEYQRDETIYHELIHVWTNKFWPSLSKHAAVTFAEIANLLSLKCVDEGIANRLSLEILFKKVGKSGGDVPTSYPAKAEASLLTGETITTLEHIGENFLELFALKSEGIESLEGYKMNNSIGQLSYLLKLNLISEISHFFKKEKLAYYCFGWRFADKIIDKLPFETMEEKVSNIYLNLPTLQELIVDPNQYLNRFIEENR